MPWVHEPATPESLECWHLRMSQPGTPGLKLYRDVDGGWLVSYRDWLLAELPECDIGKAKVEAEEELWQLLSNEWAVLEQEEA